MADDDLLLKTLENVVSAKKSYKTFAIAVLGGQASSLRDKQCSAIVPLN